MENINPEVHVISLIQTNEIVAGCELNHRNLIYGNTNIHFIECGDVNGDLVVLIHGFPNFWYLWKNQFHALVEAGFHVLAPDLRGYNTSSKPKGISSYGYAWMMQDMLHLLNYYSKDRAAMMVGHDWGAAVVWAFAEQYPSRVKRVVIVNAPHFQSIRNIWQQGIGCIIRQCFKSWYVAFFQFPNLPEAFLSYNNFSALRRALRSCSRENQSEEDIKRYVKAYSQPGALSAMINYYRALIAGYWKGIGCNVITSQVLIIWGDMDSYIEPVLANPPKNLVPNSTLIQFPKASHWPMWDEPELFNQALLKFLQPS